MGYEQGIYFGYLPMIFRREDKLYGCESIRFSTWTKRKLLNHLAGLPNKSIWENFSRSLVQSFSHSCHSLKLFCRSLEFQFNVLDMLLIQSSDADLDCITFAKGNREAEMVT